MFIGFYMGLQGRLKSEDCSMHFGMQRSSICWGLLYSRMGEEGGKS